MKPYFFPVLLVTSLALSADGAEPVAQEQQLDQGQRVFHAGHSFHMSASGVSEVCALAGIKGHQKVGGLRVGGSRVIEVWDVPEGKNTAKAALRTGTVDVLTLSPHRLHPDPGIDKFVELAVKHNPKVRVTLQQSWLAYDNDSAAQSKPPVDRESMTAEKLAKLNEKYYSEFEDQVAAINKQYGRPVVCCVPIGRAVTVLREQVRLGKVPGIAKQADLFRDPQGHPQSAVQLLNGYCHFAVIYRRSPVGLSAPKALADFKPDDRDVVNKMLQEIAWAAVVNHPQSGVKKP